MCIALVSLHIVSHDLDIDRGWQAKVQDLTDHVGWQECEAHTRKLFWQRQTKVVNVVIRGMVLGGEGHQNVGVRCADRSRIAVRKIDAAVRQAYVVNHVVDFACRNLPSNRQLDLIAKVGGFLDAHSGWRTQMKLERAAVHTRKEGPAEPRTQNRERAKAAREERNQESAPVVEANLQQAAIAVTKSLEGLFKKLLKSYKRIAAL